MNTITANERGFSLLEILIAVSVFTMALAGLLSMLLGSSHANASAAEGTNAVGIADGFLEDMRVHSAADWLAGTPAYLDDDATAESTWALPPASFYANAPVGRDWSDGAAHDAESLVQGAAGARKAIYCLHYMYKLLDDAFGAASEREALVTVRVTYTADGAESWSDCSVDTVNAALSDPDGNARAVVIPTVVRKP